MIKSIQLYSLRNEIQKYGYESVLKQVKLADFDAVETAGFYGLSAKELRLKLDEVGLSVTGLHVPISDFINDCRAVCENTVTLGAKAAIIPYVEKNYADADFFKKVNEWCEIAKNYGIAIAYHNHAFEFEDNKDLVNEISKACPNLKLELDLFWLSVAGKDTPSYIEFFKDRLLTLHIKELSREGKDAFDPFLGDGVSRLDKCIQLATAYGIDHFVVEMENYNPQIPYFDYLTKAISFLNNF